ncbi:VOC family protein [Vineibacter terrae]|uniref:VOC family protein n=1 Tax=Vineibacter terrae TaxID=2586908 RepID=UPI002E327E6C|nr:VOC family protein [Vineibacter terrae]HEX2891954.1 VOC family protein [Vineibacter terrae]
MIHGLDHIVLATRDLDAAVGAYETLLGRRCDWRGNGDGLAYAWFPLLNVSLLIVAPSGSGTMADWIEDRLNVAGEGLAGAVFAVTSLDAAQRIAGRRGLPVSDSTTLNLVHRATGEALAVAAAWLPPQATHGVRLALAERTQPGAGMDGGSAAVGRLDHMVIHSQNPERAVALYGGRLSLDLRLDLTSTDWGLRLLYFRCADVIVEISHFLATRASDDPDVLWGLAWRAADIGAAHAQLAQAGIAVSDIRPGRRPGTRVFTVRDNRARVPTLVIGSTAAPR